MTESIIFIMIASIAFALGAFVAWKPETTFQIQKKFYAMINWKIEPISFEKEMRNTKIMGASLILIDCVAIIYFVTR